MLAATDRSGVLPVPVPVGPAPVGREPCPKTMVHGPCGGVAPDGTCETGDRPCAFLAPGDTGVGSAPAAAVGPPAPPLSAAARDLLALAARRPLVLAELPSSGPDPDELRRVAAVLAGRIDAALLGDAPWARVQLPPTARAGLVAAQGLRPWASLNCRDRNRVALEGELAGLAAAGVAAVHCVTGDHPRTGGRPDARPVFDLDSTRLAALAAGTGMLVSVAESPSAPPAPERPARAAAKAAAGAHVVVVNHAGSPDELHAFVAAVRGRAPALRVLVSVPLVLSLAGAERLTTFLPGAVPADVLRVLGGPDPLADAVARATREARAALEVPGVAGVDLSGVPGPGEELRVADALARVGVELGGGAP